MSDQKISKVCSITGKLVTPKFNIGDHVIILKGRFSTIGMKTKIIAIEERREFKLEYMYLLEINEDNMNYSKYHLEDHIKLDKQWDRENKINKILK